MDTYAPEFKSDALSTPPETPKKYVPFLLYALLVLVIIEAGAAYVLIRQWTTPAPQQLAIPVPVPFVLALNSPKGVTTAVDGEILVNGNTLPDTSVVIFSDVDETSVESDANGKFESTVLVNPTGDTVTVTAYKDTGEEKSETVVLGASGVLGTSATAPGQVKKPEVKNNPKTATAPATNVVKVNPENANKSDVTVINAFRQTKSETPKTVKLGLTKITQILSSEATGSSLPKNSLKLERLEAREATPATQLKRHAVAGIITSISGDVITLSHQIQQDRTFLVYINSFTTISIKNTESASVSALTTGMRIAAVGEPVNEGILAKLIHVIPGKAIGVFNKQPVATDGGAVLLTPSPIATVSATPIPTSTESATPTESPAASP